MQTVYRVEHKEKKHEVYSCHYYGAYISGVLDAAPEDIQCIMNSMPSPRLIKGFYPRMYDDFWVFGCQNLATLEQYFGSKVWEYLKNEDFVISVYKVPNMALEIDDDGVQCMFDPKQAELVARYTHFDEIKLAA